MPHVESVKDRSGERMAAGGERWSVEAQAKFRKFRKTPPELPFRSQSVEKLAKNYHHRKIMSIMLT